MKNYVELPDDLEFFREELEEQYQTALGEVESGNRPEYAAGMFAGVKRTIEGLEARYKAHKLKLREVNSA